VHPPRPHGPFEPVPLHDALARKLGRLPGEAGPLLEVLAVSGQALVMPMLAMGLRLHADAVQDQDARQAARLRHRAWRVAKWATRLTRLFAAAYPRRQARCVHSVIVGQQEVHGSGAGG